MPYKYSKKKRILSNVLEVLTFIYFIPQKLLLKKPNTYKKILIIEPFQMGDIVSLTPLIQQLKIKRPDAEIYILTKNANKIVLKYDTRIKEVFTLDFPWSDQGRKTNNKSRLKSLYKGLKKIKKNYSFDLGVDTRGDIRSQIILKILRCKETIGYTNYINSNLNLFGLLLSKKVKKKTKYIHRYDWNLFVLTKLGLSEQEIFPINMPTFLYKEGALVDEKKSKRVVVHIGGGWVFKRWDNDKWKKTLLYLAKLQDTEIITIGGPSEEKEVNEVKMLMPENINILFKITTFDELIGYIKTSDLFIGLDSGPMNLANCLGKKTITIFGPGDSDTWHPYLKESQWVHKKENFNCNPCLQKTCIFKEKNCTAQITAEEIQVLINKSLDIK